MKNLSHYGLEKSQNELDLEYLSNFTFKVILPFLLVLSAIFLMLITPAESADYPQEVRCVIGEAASEGYEGLVAVSEAIRNRGHLNGVYGCRAKFVDREPEWVWKKANEAWEASKTSNLVKGADHWENTEDFGVPYWSKSMTLTAKIGKHSFYKGKKE